MIVEDHADHCEGCDGADDACEGYAAHEEAVNEGQRTGFFVKDRPTFFKPYAMYQLAKCERLNGGTAEATALMERAVKLRPDNEEYVATLESLRHPEGMEMAHH